jgi:hypothetical protein
MGLINEQHFSRTDTPSRFSPTGNTMLRILAKFPGLSFEDARVKANQLLNQAAGRRRYQAPSVVSPEERKERLERFKARFKSRVSAISGRVAAI